MSHIILPSGKEKTVKNLRWLISHAAEVVLIEVCPQHWFKKPAKGYEARMIARLRDNTLYITDWASIEVCREWLKARRRLSTCTMKFWL